MLVFSFRFHPLIFYYMNQISNELRERLLAADFRLQRLLAFKQGEYLKCLQNKKRKPYAPIIKGELDVINEFYISVTECLREFSRNSDNFSKSSEINTFAKYDAYLNRNWYSIKKSHSK